MLRNFCTESNSFLVQLLKIYGDLLPLVYNWIKPLLESVTMGKMGTAELATVLRKEILRGVYVDGQRLPAERVLAESYKVARGTVRSALLRLEHEGIVEIRAGSGTYVTAVTAQGYGTPIDTASPLELIDARFALEPHVCRLAVMHGRRVDFDALDDLASAMESSADNPSKFSEYDTAFHRQLVESTRNSLLIWIVSQINNVRSQDEWTKMRSVTLDEAIISRYNTQHRQVLNALRSREPERAANFMKEHLETARLSLTRAAST